MSTSLLQRISRESITTALSAKELSIHLCSVNAQNVTIGSTLPASKGASWDLGSENNSKTCEQATHSHTKDAQEYARKATQVGKIQTKTEGSTTTHTPSTQKDDDLRGQADFNPLPRPMESTIPHHLQVSLGLVGADSAKKSGN